MYTRIRPLAGPGWAPGILRDADGAALPADPASPDWRAYQDWLAGGGTPAEPATPAAPDTIEGKLLIKALTDDEAAKLKPRDLGRLAADPSIPVGNSLTKRVAATAGRNLAEWVAAARKPD